VPEATFDHAAADRNAKAMLRRLDLHRAAGTIKRHDHGALDAARLQRDRQRANDIREAAGLRETRHFGGRVKALHGAIALLSRLRLSVRGEEPMPWRFNANAKRQADG
jgi:hypothetical protein